LPSNGAAWANVQLQRGQNYRGLRQRSINALTLLWLVSQALDQTD
jgi:hypothetical protein